MKVVVKSLGVALAATGAFFSFFMMVTIAVLVVLAKLHDPNAPLQAPDVVIAPAMVFRNVGLPLSAVVFFVCFGLAMKKFRKASGHPVVARR